MAYILVFSYIADLIFGDPEGHPHPVRAIGRLIDILDKKMLYRRDSARIERFKGAMLLIIVAGSAGLSAFFLIHFLGVINPILGILMSVYFGYSAISVKDLWVKTKAVSGRLNANDMEGARKAVSMIVGRDTANLDNGQVVNAAVESIAESANDGIVAPIFYIAIGGPVAAIVYKAVNTLDSMVGHKDERYMNFGTFSAIADDILNFIPARITGLLIVLASFIAGKDSSQSFYVMRRDGRKHESPNSGIPEAAMAGGLGLKLGGGAFYDGEFYKRPYIGDGLRQAAVGDITDAMRITFIVSILIVLLGVLIRWAG